MVECLIIVCVNNDLINTLNSEMYIKSGRLYLIHCLLKYLYHSINRQLTVDGVFGMLGQHVLILVGMVSEDVLALVITLHDQTEVVIVWVI